MNAKGDPTKAEPPGQTGDARNGRENKDEGQSLGLLPFFVSRVQEMGVDVYRAFALGWGRRRYQKEEP